MSMNRRQFAAVMAAAPVALASGLPAGGAAATPGPSLPSAYRTTVGRAQVTALADGSLTLEYGLFPEAERREAERLVEAAHRSKDTIPGAVNGFLVDTGRLVLVDAGGGSALGPTAGRLLANLAAAGVGPERVETVLLTHLHPDHAGGLIGPGGAAAFPNAEVVVSEAEHAFWTDDGVLARVPEDAKPFFQLARASIAPYARAGRLRRFVPGREVVPGITSVDAPGHTPGHTLYRVVSENETLLIWGDIVHVPALQFARPDWGIAFDVDRARAAQTRRRVFDAVAADRERVAGMHIGFPGLGHVNRADGGFAFAPAFWSA